MKLGVGAGSGVIYVLLTQAGEAALEVVRAVERRIVDWPTGPTQDEVKALEHIADGIVSGLRDEKVRPYGREGTAASHWVLVDFGSVIVHVFTPPERDFYQLERHWSEAKTVLRVQ